MSLQILDLLAMDEICSWLSTEQSANQATFVAADFHAADGDGDDAPRNSGKRA
jgi:hypothetical protein